jgi:hypothetical protein
MTTNRGELAGKLALQAAEAAIGFSAKSPTGAEVVALASIALSLREIAEALSQRTEGSEA